MQLNKNKVIVETFGENKTLEANGDITIEIQPGNILLLSTSNDGVFAVFQGGHWNTARHPEIEQTPAA